jgi:hypothetical protein
LARPIGVDGGALATFGEGFAVVDAARDDKAGEREDALYLHLCLKMMARDLEALVEDGVVESVNGIAAARSVAAHLRVNSEQLEKNLAEMEVRS